MKAASLRARGALLSWIKETVMHADNDDAAQPKARENDMLKPGSPPRPATEPAGAGASTKNSKTQTDPATGQPQPKR